MDSSIPVEPAHETRRHKPARKSPSVYSGERTDFGNPAVGELPGFLHALLDRRNQDDGLHFLANIPDAATSLAFFDPQYRGVLDHQGYGNEGKRQKERAALDQMSEDAIRRFIAEIARVLTPRGHLMLCVDKFHAAEGVTPWLVGCDLKVVDMITWDKCRIGMGYRTRRRSEYLIVIQKRPIRAKGVWTLHDIPDVWQEKLPRGAGGHAHRKPVGLQAQLIAATTPEGGLVIDPAAGSFSVMTAAHQVGRRFLGCDIRN
jgi:site-specific DNA-methyltransferase (adenine-specific)